jgi:CheY-like chemotaxis protein
VDKLSKSGGILILVVEDDPDHRKALTSMLQEGGYDVEAVNDGLQAIERLRWGVRPKAILLDMRMHVMNGWEFRRELGRDPGYSSTPVLIMSGGPLKPADLVGCADWIAKPVDKAELLRKVAHCASSQQGPRSPDSRSL